MAQTSITGLLTGSSTPFLASGDVVAFVDVSDTTQSAQGSLVKGTLTQFFAAIPVPVVVTSASATALAAGPNGTTDPVLQVDASTASAATGVKVTGAAAGAGVAVAAISSGTDEALAVDAKGSGTITLGATSTGGITLARATTLSSTLTYGGVTLAASVTGTGSMVLATAPTVTTLTVSSGGIAVTGNSTITGTLSGISTLTATTFSGALSGNATTATTLQTSRTIWGQSFNGSANVSGALSGATTGSFSSNVTVGGTLAVVGVTTLGTLGVTGAITASSTINGQTISSAASFTGTLTTAGAIQVNHATQASVFVNYTGAGAIRANFTAFNSTIAIYDETNARYILQFNGATNTLSSPAAISFSNGLTVSAGTTAVQALTCTSLAPSGVFTLPISIGAHKIGTSNWFAANGSAMFFWYSGSSGITWRNFADTADIFTLSNAGAVTFAAGITATTGTFTGKISTTVTTEQMRLNYDSTHYVSTTLDSFANTTYNIVGAGGTAHYFAVNGVNSLAVGDSQINAYFTLITTAGTSSAAGFRLTEGVAPTSPINGDMWQDGTNLKIRIGGVTKTVTLT